MVLGEEKIPELYYVRSHSCLPRQTFVHLTGIARRLLFYKFLIKKSKPRPKLDRRKIGPIAQVIYEKMYTAFAK